MDRRLVVIFSIIALVAGVLLGRATKTSCHHEDTSGRVIDSLTVSIQTWQQAAQVYANDRKFLLDQLDSLTAAHSKPIKPRTTDAYRIIYGSDPDSIANILLADPK